MSPENRNLILAMAISMSILVLWQSFFVEPQIQDQQQAQQQAQQLNSDGTPQLSQKSETGQLSADTPERPSEDVPRITISAPLLEGSLTSRGARIDDLLLKNYRVALSENSENVRLFNPVSSAAPYFSEFGWVSQASDQPMPSAKTIWTILDSELTPETPVRLSWDNNKGLLFLRTVSINDDYLLKIEDTVTSTLDSAISLNPYGLVRRTGTPQTQGMWILHEGLLGVFDSALKEWNYSKLQEDNKAGFNYESEEAGGWVGITDKYWLAAIIPQQSEKVNFSMRSLSGGEDRYQSDFLGEEITLPAGGEITWSGYLFAGAKKVDLLDKYEEELGISNFDLAIDFGWFYFLTKPFFYAITYFNALLGNFGLAIIAFTILVRLVLFPLANKSFRSMGKMRELAPKIQQLRESAGDDRAKMNQEMMALYKKEKVNPAAGCLPILLQIPVFFALYKVLYVSIEMRHAPFYGWISDLSAIDPTSLFNLFGLLPYSVDFLPDFLSIGLWPILMGVTMFLQMRLNPPPPDPIQAKIFQYMPIFFTFLLASFPAGLVIYWTWNNLLSILQQWWITRDMRSK
ncbi:membrane protein insertase YidC [Alphaproteobacteria bacterium]|nr:membrane protein insertase YidC [Alphaproteobacteria bacterium]MDC0462082.1 membrane protein insertase YidC [Alphaproteobacteria bacterium]